MEWFSMMFGGAGRGWIEAALLLGLFWAALAHPEQIRSVLQFRIATLLLALSMVVPAIVQAFVLGRVRDASRQFDVSADSTAGMYAVALAPMLSMLAVLFGVGSVTPRASDE